MENISFQKHPPWKEKYLNKNHCIGFFVFPYQDISRLVIRAVLFWPGLLYPLWYNLSPTYFSCACSISITTNCSAKHTNVSLSGYKCDDCDFYFWIKSTDLILSCTSWVIRNEFYDISITRNVGPDGFNAGVSRKLVFSAQPYFNPKRRVMRQKWTHEHKVFEMYAQAPLTVLKFASPHPVLFFP